MSNRISVFALSFAIWVCAILFCATIITNLFLYRTNLVLGLGQIDNIIVGERKIFLAEMNHCRVYVYDHNGCLLDWMRVGAKQIHITAKGTSVICHYWDQEVPIYEREIPQDENAVAIEVDRNFFGHPYLVVKSESRNDRASLQRWYLTLVQVPYPGMLWGPILFLLIVVRIRIKKKTTNLQGNGKTDT